MSLVVANERANRNFAGKRNQGNKITTNPPRRPKDLTKEVGLGGWNPSEQDTGLRQKD